MGLCWRPRKCIIRVGPNLSGGHGGAQYMVGTCYAWWQWRQRLRTRSIDNMDRFYLRPLIFGRDPR